MTGWSQPFPLLLLPPVTVVLILSEGFDRIEGCNSAGKGDRLRPGLTENQHDDASTPEMAHDWQYLCEKPSARRGRPEVVWGRVAYDTIVEGGTPVVYVVEGPSIPTLVWTATIV